VRIDRSEVPGGIGESLREKVNSYYSWNRVTEDYRQVFEDSLEQSREQLP
jgi:hypothetical protein